jgi:hypothetical protein
MKWALRVLLLTLTITAAGAALDAPSLRLLGRPELPR